LSCDCESLYVCCLYRNKGEMIKVPTISMYFNTQSIAEGCWIARLGVRCESLCAHVSIPNAAITVKRIPYMSPFVTIQQWHRMDPASSFFFVLLTAVGSNYR
jgi:hypothetical protein